MGPAQRLVEGSSSGEIGDPKGNQTYALLDSRIMTNASAGRLRGIPIRRFEAVWRFPCREPRTSRASAVQSCQARDRAARDNGP